MYNNRKIEKIMGAKCYLINVCRLIVKRGGKCRSYLDARFEKSIFLAFQWKKVARDGILIFYWK